RDLAGQPVRHPDVDADLLAVAAAQRPRTDHHRATPQRRGPPVGDPDRGLRARRRLTDHLVHDLAQVHAFGRLDGAGRTDDRHVRAYAGEPERAGGVSIAVVADEVPAAPI